ncbi:MAG: AI-2E family transporter [Clostridia bacterium]|nr:AI-2E family transporter [Clostridia bacterium]
MQISWKNCFKIGFSIFILYLCIAYFKYVSTFVKTLLGASAPLIIGGAIAYIVDIPMSFYERHIFIKTKKKFLQKLRRPLCLFLAFLSIVAVAVVVVSLVFPQLVSCVKLIIAKLPGVLDNLMDSIEKIKIIPKDITGVLSDINWKSRIDSLISIVSSGAGNVLGVLVSTLVSVFSGLTTALVALIFSVYLLASKNKIKHQFVKLFKRYLPKKIIEKIKYVINVFDESFHRYFVAQCTDALILGVLCSLGMLVFGMPYAAMIGALIAFTALVPIVGAFIGAAVGAFMILTVSPFKALMFIIFIIVLQQIEENLIYPKVVGTSVNLPSIWVLASITLGGGIMGITGILLAVPIVAALYRILKDDINKNTVKYGN